jgi:hypothetical protein
MATTVDDLLEILAGCNSIHPVTISPLSPQPGFWPGMDPRSDHSAQTEADAGAEEETSDNRAEHEQVLASELNRERRNFYDLLWEIGSAQRDAASLTAENIDWHSFTRP